mgnify:CR=1 FL=1
MIKNFIIVGLTIALLVTCYKYKSLESAFLEYKEANNRTEQERIITLEEVPAVEFEGEEIKMSGDFTLTC